MFENLKDFFLFCYEAADRMDEKSSYYHAMRRERMEEFRKKHKEATEKAKEHAQERLEEMRTIRTEKIKEIFDETGVATKEELEDVKILLEELNKKIDVLAGKGKKKTG